MRKLYHRFLSISLFLLAITALYGCSSEVDEDGIRAGAIKIQLDQVTSDEIYATAGDEIDWKMVFIPAPGDIIVNTFWDTPLEVFNVSLGIYDRFGIPIKKMDRDTGGATMELRAFSPEGGLHYIKVSATGGRSIYSIITRYEENDGEMVAPAIMPTFEAYTDFESEAAANAANAKDKKGKKGGRSAAEEAEDEQENSGGGKGGGGGIALPSAVAGGAVLPSAAAGGMASAGSSGPTIVKSSSSSRVSPAEVKSVNSKAAPAQAAPAKSSVKAICPDIKGSYKKINAEILAITPKKGSSTQIKLNVGKVQGVNEGAVGDIYIDGKILDGGRFKVTKILERNCLAETNASAADVKKASAFVVKSPE